MNKNDIPVTFSTKECKNIYDALPPSIQKNILSVEEMYYPKHIVCASTQIYYDSINIAELMKMKNFVAIKLMTKWDSQKSEIIFEK